MPKGPTKKSSLPVDMRTFPPPGTPHSYTYYEEAFPRSEGPPRVANNAGATAVAESEHLVTVTMDAGAYRAVWELLEATARARWDVRNSMQSAAAYVRAVAALRKGWKDSEPSV